MGQFYFSKNDQASRTAQTRRAPASSARRMERASHGVQDADAGSGSPPVTLVPDGDSGSGSGSVQVIFTTVFSEIRSIN